jgi:Ca2+-binding EF-hand superfamily protein
MPQWFASCKCATLHDAQVAHVGFSLDPTAFRALFRAYDATRQDSLDMAEFIALSFFLKAASGMFHVFDYQRVGSITLDFNQFVYACTFCR